MPARAELDVQTALSNRENVETDPHAVAGVAGGSRSDQNTKLVISPDGVGDSNCRSVLNSTLSTLFFIPWKSASEWTAFLAAVKAGTVTDKAGSSLKVETAPCCVPTIATICNQKHNLGQRVAATRKQGEIPGFGAEGDIYGPVSAGVDRIETWGCTQGQWTLIKQSGTCNGVDSQCGSASGQASPVAPANLCASGNTASAVALIDEGTGAFHWAWTCKGTSVDNGAPITCTAPVKPAGSACGSANGQSFSTISGSLCAANNGVLNYRFDSTLNQWLWSCFGYPQGSSTPIQCAAFFSSDNGKCGAYAFTYMQTIPLNNLCTYGTPTLITDNGWYWSWYCNGQNKGTNAWCYNIKVPPKCGYINGTMIENPPQSSLDMCSDGSPGTLSGTAATGWRWSCVSNSNGATVSCSTLPVQNTDGACGTSDKAVMPDVPNRNLCAAGTAQPVTGNGPWTWVCKGIGTGKSVTCAAQKCLVCQGSVTQSFSTEVKDGSVKLQDSVCPAWGVTKWTETILRSPINQASTISWTDPFNGNFTKTYQPARVGTPYCEPCFYRTTAVTNAQVSAKLKDSCGGGTANTYITLPAQGITVQ